MSRALLLIACLVMGCNSYGQTMTTLDKIEQIYPSSSYDMDIDSKKVFIHLLEKRILIYENNGVDSDKYPLLSSVPLLNKYNSSIKKITEEGYDATTFNPLKYSLPFFVYDANSLHYFIDGTNLILEIKPQ